MWPGGERLVCRPGQQETRVWRGGRDSGPVELGLPRRSVSPVVGAGTEERLGALTRGGGRRQRGALGKGSPEQALGCGTGWPGWRGRIEKEVLGMLRSRFWLEVGVGLVRWRWGVGGAGRTLGAGGLPRRPRRFGLQPVGERELGMTFRSGSTHGRARRQGRWREPRPQGHSAELSPLTPFSSCVCFGARPLTGLRLVPHL